MKLPSYELCTSFFRFNFFFPSKDHQTNLGWTIRRRIQLTIADDSPLLKWSISSFSFIFLRSFRLGYTFNRRIFRLFPIHFKVFFLNGFTAIQLVFQSRKNMEILVVLRGFLHYSKSKSHWSNNNASSCQFSNTAPVSNATFMNRLQFFWKKYFASFFVVKKNSNSNTICIKGKMKTNKK